MKKTGLLAITFFCACSVFTKFVFAEEFPVVVSVSDYKIAPGKYDEISDPDVYFSIIYNNTKIETSNPVRDNNFYSYGEMKSFGDYCQGISNLTSGDKLIIKFYDLDYDTGNVKRFWEWIQGSSYEYMVYFTKQIELMNDKDKKYDDFDAYETAKNDPELKKIENEITDNVMEINNRRNNKEETEYLGEITIDVDEVMESFRSGEEQYAANYEIKDLKTDKTIGKANVVVKRFEGFGSSIKIKSY